VDVIVRDVPENVAVTDDGFFGNSPSSCAWKAALTSLFLHSNCALVMTAVPSKNVNGLGNLALVVDGNVVGMFGHAVSWRRSTTGAAETVIARSGRTMEYFMTRDWLILKMSMG
jgi:hypothetical protein